MGLFGRAMVNIAFANLFWSSFVEVASRKILDHNPLVVFFDVLRASYGPTIF